MKKFDKIKTSADKRLAQDKRGKAVNNDLQPGDKITLTEKLDGHQVVFDGVGEMSSRRSPLSHDESQMVHNKSLIPFTKLVAELKLDQLAADHFGTTDVTVFSEALVPNRLIDYDREGHIYVFDVHDGEKYLGPEAAADFAETIEDPRVMPVNILGTIEFTDYASLEKAVHEMSGSSELSTDGRMEGVVAVANRYDGQSRVRVKIVNQEFKETQRSVTNSKAHSTAVRWLNQYLTQTRVTKIVKSMITDGELRPGEEDYYTTQLATAVKRIHEDILEESTDTPQSFTDKQATDIYNKIEAKARLTMRDELNYSSLENGLEELNNGLSK